MKRKFECTRDGLHIRGYEYRTRFGILPAVILSHGFLANKDTVKNYAKLISRLGYAAFTFDFSGGGPLSESDGDSRDMTVFTELSDLKAVIDSVSERKNIRKDNILLLGCSQGGVVSALAAKELGEKIKKLILLYPAFCIPDDARRGKMMKAQFDPDDIPDVIMTDPMTVGGEYARSVISLSLSDIIGEYKGPVLILHGTRDRIVDISYAREAAEKYQDIEYHEIEDAGHGFRKKKYKIAAEYIKNFIKK